MNRFTWGILIGMFIGSLLGGVVQAATRATLTNGSGVEIGTVSNPLYIQ